MPKKDEKKPSEKETYRLWWEYLKRSEIYKAYCDALQKTGKSANSKADSHSAEIYFGESNPELLDRLFTMGLNWNLLSQEKNSFYPFGS